MLTEVVQKFWQQAQIDQALQAQLGAIQEKQRHTAVAAVVKVAAVAGFVFTSADYEAALKEEIAKQYAAGELTQEQLGTLAGAVLIPEFRIQCGPDAVSATENH